MSIEMSNVNGTSGAGDDDVTDPEGANLMTVNDKETITAEV